MNRATPVPPRGYKRWPAWALMGVIVVALLAVGIDRAAAPRTADERVQSIAEQLACPVCNGESVADSRAPSSEQIKENIRRLVTEGQLTDDEIVARIDANYEQDLHLVPGRSGFDVLAWVLPVVAAVAGVAGLVAAFARWRRGPNGPAVSDDDRALVEAALDRMDRS